MESNGDIFGWWYRIRLLLRLGLGSGKTLPARVYTKLRFVTKDSNINVVGVSDPQVQRGNIDVSYPSTPSVLRYPVLTFMIIRSGSSSGHLPTSLLLPEYYLKSNVNILPQLVS